MDINLIKTYLEDSDPQKRMKAVLELRSYDAEVAIPLLIAQMNDREFLVRSFVAMGLGRKQNAESFARLLEMMKFDRDPNVRAEAANSLSYYGEVSVSHLRLMFEQDDHWLIRRSILAALAELNCPAELLEVALIGVAGDDLSVRSSSIDCLGVLGNTDKQAPALEKLLSLVDDESWRIRLRVATALGKFDDSRAKEALNKLKEDPNHKVVGAVLNSLV
ncbi:PBS lyase HEAT-like repeat protein [Hyella patelloides LEGE 07179]|uniref:PBS lyase HEAT-like repeat protein n=1 Tax=Hyella patelloides LEGE 07179 TaxID=945734 RepID=A0A563W3J8_9CYAN|nr:HEAT repeat domain-containing protein [Hyella patelloides]VEP18254.1 PBS lyase HEAT-like repeat protein [Hyella patelloides LEGE 07179]